jgi:hypothetical protein
MHRRRARRILCSVVQYGEPGRWNPSREAKRIQVRTLVRRASIYSADQVLSTVIYSKYPAYAERTGGQSCEQVSYVGLKLSLLNNCNIRESPSTRLAQGLSTQCSLLRRSSFGHDAAAAFAPAPAARSDCNRRNFRKKCRNTSIITISPQGLTSS